MQQLLPEAHPQGQPKTDSGWALEESLDVEWAHAIAPGATILLVEASSASISSLLAAVDYAVSQGASVVSMSWGSSSEFLGETSFDSHFTAPGVTFTASSGDSGPGVIYPAASPYVTSVGGTTLPLDSSGNLTAAETAWSGSGGGVSVYEPTPSYQSSIGAAGRSVPDVAYDADPNTGVAVYDSTAYSGQSGWFVVGGTSAGAPQWGALAAIVNSQRSTPLGGANPALYAPPAADFRDEISPSPAGPGYDTRPVSAARSRTCSCRRLRPHKRGHSRSPPALRPSRLAPSPARSRSSSRAHLPQTSPSPSSPALLRAASRPPRAAHGARRSR